MSQEDENPNRLFIIRKSCTKVKVLYLKKKFSAKLVAITKKIKYVLGITAIQGYPQFSDKTETIAVATNLKVLTESRKDTAVRWLYWKAGPN